MRGVVAVIAILAVIGGGAWWIWGHYAHASDAVLSGSSIESFGTTGYITMDVRARSTAGEDGNRATARWQRKISIGTQQLTLDGTFAYADEPVERPTFTGRRALAKWEEKGTFGNQPLVIQGEWVEASASGSDGLGAESHTTRTVSWGSRTIKIDGEGRVSADPGGETSIYAESMNVAGLPVLTVVRYQAKTTPDGVWNVTWTRTTTVGSGNNQSQYKNSGNYSGPYMPIAAIASPYEVITLLSAAEGK